MIIARTPYRLSFFGGGTDYSGWLTKNEGAVISTTINKYIYILLNTKSSIFHKKYRIVYKNIENKKKISEINHPAVRKCLDYFDIPPGVELTYMGDLPARSGLGSSSSFTVGLLNCLYTLKNKKMTKKKLAEKAIFVEQKLLKENVGLQDQIATAYGGFNLIKFKKEKFQVSKINISTDILELLNKNLVLCYSGIQRTADDIAKNYIKKISSTILRKTMHDTYDLVSEGNSLLKKGNIDEFGKLLNVSWNLKKKLHKVISSSRLDDFYNYAITKGALGGKLLGAGGGGFFLFYVPEKKIKKFKKTFKKTFFSEFQFEKFGSTIVNNIK